MIALLLLHTCVADLLFTLLLLGTEIIIILRHPVFDGPAWLCQKYGECATIYGHVKKRDLMLSGYTMIRGIVVDS
uniref:Uncharacterized protein n=1 Tax=Wuchereria bancrofti TaxID=6293 RepID=A0AAF5PJX7_WUCBA